MLCAGKQFPCSGGFVAGSRPPEAGEEGATVPAFPWAASGPHPLSCVTQEVEQRPENPETDRKLAQLTDPPGKEKIPRFLPPTHGG